MCSAKNYVDRERKCDFQTGFYTGRHTEDNLLDFEPVYERICKIWVKLQYYNVTYISTHASTEDKGVAVKGEFYISLEKVCDAVPHDMDNNTRGLQC